MKNRIAIIAALVCAAFAVAIAGCGGGDDSSTTTTSAGVSGATGASGAPLTKDQFIQQADAICQEGNQATRQAANDLFSGGQQPTDEQVSQYVDQTLVPTIQSEIDQIGELTPPAGDEDDVQAILSAVSDALDQVKQSPSSLLASGDEGPFAEADRLAVDYGLKVCGQG